GSILVFAPRSVRMGVGVNRLRVVALHLVEEAQNAVARLDRIIPAHHERWHVTQAQTLTEPPTEPGGGVLQRGHAVSALLLLAIDRDPHGDVAQVASGRYAGHRREP